MKTKSSNDIKAQRDRCITLLAQAPHNELWLPRFNLVTNLAHAYLSNIREKQGAFSRPSRMRPDSQYAKKVYAHWPQRWFIDPDEAYDRQRLGE